MTGSVQRLGGGFGWNAGCFPPDCIPLEKTGQRYLNSLPPSLSLSVSEALNPQRTCCSAPPPLPRGPVPARPQKFLIIPDQDAPACAGVSNPAGDVYFFKDFSVADIFPMSI